MATRFITQKTSRLYEASTGLSYHMVLIFGDEVEINGASENGRTPAVFRGRHGYITDSHLGQTATLELYFIDVGQGDATFIVTPGRKKILIDGGQNERALGFLAWKYRLDQAGPPIDLDLLVLSHSDADHLNGLTPIVKHPQINVKKVVHSGIATFQDGAFATTLGNLNPPETHLVTRHQSLADLAGLPLSDDFAAWRDALIAENVVYTAVDANSGNVDVGDPAITLEVVGPLLDMVGGAPALPWFSNVPHTINGHSVILRLTYQNVAGFFAGDLNIPGAKHLLAQPALAAKMDAHVFKAPHHGSHEFHPPLLQAIRPQISVISSGDEPDHGHPRAAFIGGVGLASRSPKPLVFSTEIAATFVEAGEVLAADSVLGTRLIGEDFSTPAANVIARRLFKRRLHGMINVRTNGQKLFAARRVAAGYWWESYGPLAPAPWS